MIEFDRKNAWRRNVAVLLEEFPGVVRSWGHVLGQVLNGIAIDILHFLSKKRDPTTQKAFTTTLKNHQKPMLLEDSDNSVIFRAPFGDRSRTNHICLCDIA